MLLQSAKNTTHRLRQSFTNPAVALMPTSKRRTFVAKFKTDAVVVGERVNVHETTVSRIQSSDRHALTLGARKI
jgi:predicted AAA+ superfamily ATPase